MNDGKANNVAELSPAEKKRVNLIWLLALVSLLIERYFFPDLGLYLVIIPTWFLLLARFIPESTERKRATASTVWLIIILLIYWGISQFPLLNNMKEPDDAKSRLMYRCITDFVFVSLLFFYLAAVGWRVFQESFGRFKPESKGYHSYSRPWWSMWLLPAYLIAIAPCLISLFMSLWIESKI